jgi:trigger factor
MHEIGHLAEESERSPEEIAETMKANGTYALLREEISRQKALDFLAENATPVEMPEEEESAEAEVPEEEPSIEAGEETPGAEEEPEGGEAVVETTVEAGAEGDDDQDDQKEKE